MRATHEHEREIRAHGRIAVPVLLRERGGGRIPIHPKEHHSHRASLLVVHIIHITRYSNEMNIRYGVNVASHYYIL